ncbi:MAG: hypothetical protein IKO14_07525 [Oscillibacter sp.]|nr:hypothetical protein [Oscillibacter sp.]
MTERQRLALDFRQNLAIALLSVMAVALFARTELFHLGWETVSGEFQAVSEPPETAPEEPVPSTLSVPVRFAATGVYGDVRGRYVSLGMKTGERAFRGVRRLFREALESSTDFDRISRETFLSSVRGSSLYCDFLTPLPLSLLCGLLDASSTDERPVRCMALARDWDGVRLYIWDGGAEYSGRLTAISGRQVDELVSNYELGSGVFGMDFQDADGRRRNVSPLSLFPDKAPSLPVYAVSVSLPDTGQLLTAFRFNPLTKSRYTEANGTEVIMEGGRSVRIRTNGTIYYQSGERGELSIESAAEIPTTWEAVTECAALLNSILVAQGYAPVIPREVRRQDNLTLLRFGYALNGVPVFHADGGAAAVVTLDCRKVVSVELRPRRYSATDAQSLLLPLEQALGVAELHPGAELCLGYQDNGGARMNAQWFAVPE